MNAFESNETKFHKAKRGSYYCDKRVYFRFKEGKLNGSVSLNLYSN